jgi:hypothetical protein
MGVRATEWVATSERIVLPRQEANRVSGKELGGPGVVVARPQILESTFRIDVFAVVPKWRRCCPCMSGYVAVGIVVIRSDDRSTGIG